MDEKIAQIKTICLDSRRTGYIRLKDIFKLLGGDPAEFVKAHEKEDDDDMAVRKRMIRKAIQDGYLSLTGEPLPCSNWAKWTKVCGKAAEALTVEQIKSIERKYAEIVAKKKNGYSLTFEEKFVISNMSAEGLAYKTADVLAKCVSAKAERAKFTGEGRL
jgi:hypothetical protein